MRRASSRVSSLAAAHPPGSLLEIEIRKRLPAGVPLAELLRAAPLFPAGGPSANPQGRRAPWPTRQVFSRSSAIFCRTCKIWSLTSSENFLCKAYSVRPYVDRPWDILLSFRFSTFIGATRNGCSNQDACATTLQFRGSSPLAFPR